MLEEKEKTDAFKTGFYADYSQREYTQASFNYPTGESADLTALSLPIHPRTDLPGQMCF